MESWTFVTNHARVLLCIARDPGVRLRDLAARLGITERSAHAIIADLTAAGYVVKHKHGRRNRYQIQAHLPLPEPASREPAIGDVLALAGVRRRRAATPGASDQSRASRHQRQCQPAASRDPLRNPGRGPRRGCTSDEVGEAAPSGKKIRVAALTRRSH